MWDQSVEPIARAIHERWRSEQIVAGNPAPSWEELDESRKESSRDNARDIRVKLRMVGCDIAPLREPDAKDFTFTDAEVETLGAAEHLRWMRERIGDGSTTVTDVVRRSSPVGDEHRNTPRGSCCPPRRVGQPTVAWRLRWATSTATLPGHG